MQLAIAFRDNIRLRHFASCFLHTQGGIGMAEEPVHGHMSMEPGSAGSKVRGTQAASSSIRRTPNEYS
jgi:hypothetical protein